MLLRLNENSNYETSIVKGVKIEKHKSVEVNLTEKEFTDLMLKRRDIIVTLKSNKIEEPVEELVEEPKKKGLFSGKKKSRSKKV